MALNANICKVKHCIWYLDIVEPIAFLRLVFYLADMSSPLTVGKTTNTTEAGRYSTEGWMQQVKSKFKM